MVYLLDLTVNWDDELKKKKKKWSLMETFKPIENLLQKYTFSYG